MLHTAPSMLTIPSPCTLQKTSMPSTISWCVNVNTPVNPGALKVHIILLDKEKTRLRCIFSATSDMQGGRGSLQSTAAPHAEAEPAWA